MEVIPAETIHWNDISIAGDVHRGSGQRAHPAGPGPQQPGGRVRRLAALHLEFKSIL